MPVKSDKLIKVGKDIFKLEADNPKQKCTQRVNFLQFCFDESEERAAAVDSIGYFYFFLLINNDWTVKKFKNVGQSTLVAFNPIDQCEVIIGLASTDLKVIRFNQVFNDAESIEDYYLLKGHQLPATWISFFKSYFFSVSRSEAIIWDLKSFAKLHQLRLESGEGGIRKGLLSPSGLITAIYENDILQVWPFEQFDMVNKISLSKYGLNKAKDIIFTENGRAALICGGKNKIIIFNTKTWSVVKNFEFSEHFSSIKRLQIVPLPLDGGSNKIISVLFDDGTFKFLDVNLKSFIEVTDCVSQGICKLTVSPHGQWVGFIQYDGSLIISCFDQLMKVTAEVTKIKPTTSFASSKTTAHTIDQHLKYIERNIKDNLRLDRLLPILKEYGEYPERYRPIIWRTILKLPGNKKAFTGIISKVPTDSAIKMLDYYKLADKTKQSLLGLTVERLIQFCPMFSQSLFLPEFIFPFIMVFKKDHLFAYEAVLTIILNYCQKWFEYHPFPPINIVGIIENILAETDPVLLKFYYDKNITSTIYAWPLLQTAMSEILTGNEWLILWDHLLSFRKPSLLLLAVVAYNICSRRIILSLTNKERIEDFFRQPGQVPVKDVIKEALRIDRQVSKKNHPAQYLKDTFRKLPPDGPYPTFLFEEYPKFIIEDRKKMNEFINLKDEELSLRKQRQQILEMVEEKRLNDEKEIFIKQIQEKRLRESRRCYEEQFRECETLVSDERQKFYRQMVLSGSTDVLGVNPASNKSGSRSNIKSYHELRDDVDALEEEIRRFLRTIKCKG